MGDLHTPNVQHVLCVPELGDQIVHSIESKTDLSNFRLVSRLFDHVASRIVWRTLHVDLQRAQFAMELEFLSNLKKWPHVLALVRDLTVTFGDKFNYVSPDIRYHKEYMYRCAVVTDLLKSLPSLRHFRYEIAAIRKAKSDDR